MDTEIADTLEALCNLVYLARTAGDVEMAAQYLARADTLLQVLIPRILTMSVAQTPYPLH